MPTPCPSHQPWEGKNSSLLAIFHQERIFGTALPILDVLCGNLPGSPTIVVPALHLVGHELGTHHRQCQALRIHHTPTREPLALLLPLQRRQVIRESSHFLPCS